jgi:CRISPR-associated helicase Cas3/CRISPR-associated endonuclease Cas3-HD
MDSAVDALGPYSSAELLSLDALWAKSTKGSPGAYHALPCHLCDATLAAGSLWRSWMPRAFRRRLASQFPGGDDEAQAFLMCLAGLHDIGKASPGFQAKVPELAARVQAAGYPFPSVRLSKREDVPHQIVSALAILAILQEEGLGWPSANARLVAEILASHHGQFPADIMWTQPKPAIGTQPPWVNARAALFDLVCAAAGLTREHVSSWRSITLPQHTRMALAGLVTLIDWVASTERCFPYRVVFEDGYERGAAERSDEAVVALDLAHRWSASEAEGAENWFQERFGFEPRPVQTAAMAVTEMSESPGLVIIEAPTGEGKTEAALALAERVAARSGFEGLFVGLPTQATGNQLFRRVTSWLGRVPGRHHVALAHGKAALEPSYRRLLEMPPTQVAIDAGVADSGAVEASVWTTGRKRALLAPVVVGTVDQLLLAAVSARHVALRHAALAGKVVVVDEVHAYDAYMSVFLHKALRWLGEAGVPVILLSATLPSITRQRLIDAYAGREINLVSEDAYPRITLVEMSDGAPMAREEKPASARAVVDVSVQLVEEKPGEPSSVLDLVEQKLQHGGCALVVRNTVSRAQATFRELSARLGPDHCTLVHSRFTAGDRLRWEHDLEARFGPAASSRPERHVVVGTQVVEQSLDVDFDLLVTDLAPIDLVIQRAGRMHRHSRPRPQALSAPQIVVGGWWLDETGQPRVAPGSARIYSEYRLLRTLLVLQGVVSFSFPTAIPSLVEAVYGAPTLPTEPTLAERLERLASDERTKLDRRVHQARQIALNDPALDPASPLGDASPYQFGEAADDDDPGVRAQVRDGSPTVEVILIDGSSDDGSITVGAQQISVVDPPDAETIELLMRRALPLPPYLLEEALQHLEVPKAWRANPWLRGRPPLIANAHGLARIGAFELVYSGSLGLEVLGARR